MLSIVQALQWTELESVATSSFSSAEATRIGRMHVREGVDRDDIEAAVDRDLLHSYGAWVAGWNWSISEAGGGGPIGAWCCADHSILQAGETAEASVDRITAAVVEWHEFVTSLSCMFSTLHERTADLGPQESVEFAAAEILTLTLTRTDASDAWYATFARLLSWYLEATGWDSIDVTEAVEQVASARFDSWIAPSNEVASQTCAELGRAVLHPIPPHDATEDWRLIRKDAFANSRDFSIPSRSGKDGHLEYIHKVDKKQTDRANRMKAALSLCRMAAKRGKALTVSEISKWQAVVLGHPVTVRSEDAWARNGRVRYGSIDANEVDRWLNDANSTEPLCVRAARAYLDICFAHPFPDGNARAARLVLDYLITRDGMVLHAADAVFCLDRNAKDDRGAWLLAYTIQQLLARAD